MTADRRPPQDPLTAALAGVIRSTGACHASAMRYDPSRTHLVVAAVEGLPFLTPGMELAAEELDDLLAAADVAPLVLPTVAFLAGSAGVDDTLAVPLRRKDGRIEGLLYLAWEDAAAAPADRTALGTVDWHVRHVRRALLAADHDLTSAVVAHEDELVAGGVARRLERRWPIGVSTCSSLPGMQRTLEQGDGPDVVLLSDGLAPDVALPDVAAAVRGTSPESRLVVLTRAATPTSIERAQAAAAHGIVALDDGAPELLRVVDAVSRGETVAAGLV